MELPSLATIGVVLAVWCGYELVRGFVVRRARRVLRDGAIAFVRRHRIRLESASFIDRIWIREALAQDADIEEAIARLARSTEETPEELRRRVDAYVDEIAPFFSLSAYYRFGASLGRRVVDFCFELVFEPAAFERQLKAVPPGAVRVYVINHRANMDPLILAYGLLNHVPMSYAVGEWALVWPLHTLFRAFGSYFVRRGEKDPLYHAVLRRFLQLMAREGAVTGFFIEGGLSRDGALRRPRTGLLDYLIQLRREQPDREIVFLPVGLNYDRVLEDRILTRDKSERRETRLQRVVNVLALCFWVPQLVLAKLAGVAVRAHRKLGYAAVCFGEPLKLTDFEGGARLHTLDDEARRPVLERLAHELLNERIGQVVPATPVPILATALGRPGPGDEAALTHRVADVCRELRAVGAPVALGRAFDSVKSEREGAIEPAIHADFDAALLDAEEAERIYLAASYSLVRRRVLRRVVTPTGEGLEVMPGSERVLRYYANSLSHHLTPGHVGGS